MPNTTLTTEEKNFLENLGIDTNSPNLKEIITSLIQNNSTKTSNSPQKNLEEKSSNSANNSQISQILTKIYKEIIPKLESEGKTWEIDFDFERKENKRYENLKKRGCNQIIKI